MELKDVVMKLVGPISPIGETNYDRGVLENAKVLTQLVDDLLTDIDQVASDNKDRHQHSMALVGEHCSEFFDQIEINQ